MPILITGAPGIGKSDIVAQAAQAAGAALIISHPAVSDPTDFKGLPWPDASKDSARFLPFGEFHAALTATATTVWLLDDLGQASPAVQAACFPSHTPVLCNDGVKDIATVAVGDMVMDENGIFQQVTETFKRTAQGMITIKAVGLLPIESTPDHPFLVSSGRKRKYRKTESDGYAIVSEKIGDPTWMDAKEIKSGDWVAVPIPQGIWSEPEITFSEIGQIRRSVQVTEELAELIGFYVGDGWFVQHKAVQAIEFALDDAWPEIQDRLKYLISVVIDGTIYSRKRKGHHCIGFHDVSFGQWLVTQCGNRSWNKRIPSWIITHSDINIVSSFLRGYLATDGALMRDHGTVRGLQWNTVSRTLALQTQSLLTRYGSLGTLKMRGGGKAIFHGKECNTRVSYHLQCSEKRLMQSLGEEFEPKRSVSWSFEHAGKIWTRVVSAEASAVDCDVFNIEVENSHTYTAANCVVHNCMQLLLARRVNGHILPDCVSFVAATNRRTDRAGVSGILEPVKSRFSAIVELTPDIDDWCLWAINHGIQSTLIAFLRFRPDLLSNFQPSQDMTNSPCPRTWASLAKLEALQLPAALEAEALTGAVGQGAATEYLAFRKLASALVSVDQILLDPKGSPIPSKPAELYAVSCALACKANDKNLSRIAAYVERMTTEGKGEFAALTLRDAVRRNSTLTHSDAFIKLACGPLGALISGQEG
jgi:hypothetical protein